MKRSRISFVLAMLAVFGLLGWLAYAVHGPSSVATNAPTNAAASAPSVERQLAAARSEAALRMPAAKVVLPRNPPPRGLPTTATQLATQPRQAMPTPRGTVPN